MTTKDDFINKVVQEEFGFIDYQTAFVHSEPEEFTRIMYRVMEEYALACLEKAASKTKVIDGFSGVSQQTFEILDANMCDWNFLADKESIISKDNLV
jgi:hypothetical protein